VPTGLSDEIEAAQLIFRGIDIADIAIAGAGLVGLFSALLLARSGHQVVLLEPDEDPLPKSADDVFFGWHRPGVPQNLHGHVFRRRVGRVLREEGPDVLDKLLDSGIDKAGYDFGKGFELDVSPMSRRPCSRPSFAGSFAGRAVCSSGRAFELSDWSQRTGAASHMS
jgi:hypothetical protein